MSPDPTGFISANWLPCAGRCWLSPPQRFCGLCEPVLDDELTFEITSRQKSKATQRGDLIIYPADAMRFLFCYVFVTASPAQNFAPPESLAGKRAAMRFTTRVLLLIMNQRRTSRRLRPRTRRAPERACGRSPASRNAALSCPLARRAFVCDWSNFVEMTTSPPIQSSDRSPSRPCHIGRSRAGSAH